MPFLLILFIFSYNVMDTVGRYLISLTIFYLKVHINILLIWLWPVANIYSVISDFLYCKIDDTVEVGRFSLRFSFKIPTVYIITRLKLWIHIHMMFLFCFTDRGSGIPQNGNYIYTIRSISEFLFVCFPFLVLLL